MFKLHKDIDDWYYWYSPRSRKWCGLHKVYYRFSKDIIWNERWAIKYNSKFNLKQAMDDCKKKKVYR